MIPRILVLFTAACLASAGRADAALHLQQLQVEYRTTPLGLDVVEPRFSWHMTADAGERNVAQVAWRVEVRDATTVVWDTGRREDPTSLGLRYAGTALKPATRYTWVVTVWATTGETLSAGSWFETGLMDPSPDASAWGGAQWIGGGDDDLVLYAPYLAIFDLSYAVTIPAGSTRASFVYGANDSRLMDRFKNVYQIQNTKNASYIKLELDVAGLEGRPDGRAKLHVYRVGYKPTDTASKPLQSFDVPTDVIGAANAHAEHEIRVRSAFGQIAVSVDGKTSLTRVSDGTATAAPPAPGPGRAMPPNGMNLNPLGEGGDYLAFGLLCDIGFSVEAGQSATFRNVTVRNTRAPRNILFRDDTTRTPYDGLYAGAMGQGSGLSIADGRLVVKGGDRGAFVVRDPSHNASPMLRTTFTASSRRIASARLYVTARGIYEVFLNGTRVGDDHYNPGLTQYNVTHLYQTYDVTALVRPGSNAIGAWLGEGWWSGLLSFGAIWNHFGDRQSFRAKLVVTYEDGNSDTLVTNDRTWKYYGAGPIVYSSLDLGEVYDASRESAIEGWSTAPYDDRRWKPAVAVPLEGSAFIGNDIGFTGRPGTPLNYDTLSLIGQIGETAGEFKTLPARSVKEVRPGVFVYDLGQNIVGVPRVRLANRRAGQRITLRYAEMLYPDLPESGGNVGMIMTENYRAALSQDVYVSKAGSQVIQPRFTSHGFQYVEITGIDRPLPLDAVEGVAISSIRALTADYRTSSDAVNRLWSNLVWSNIDNFLTIPTDCPQRNERMGWSGDINVFAATATYVSNASQFLTRHLQAMRDVQAPSGRFTDIAPVGGGFGGVLWGSAGIVVAWETYLQYDDVGLLERHYPAMAAYVDYLETTIDPATGLSSDAALGDWLGPQNNALGSPFLATAYHAYDLGIMVRVAEIVGKPDDAARYRAAYEKRKQFFNTTFVDADGRTRATGRGGFGPPPPPGPPQFRLADTQTSYAVGLGMGLIDEASRPAVANRLADAISRENTDDEGKVRPKYSLMTGFIGTAWISKALSDAGHSELAYRLLHNRQYPSWLYPVEQGATTIWERLNGYTIENGFGGNNSMNSFNHYSFGAVGQWMIAHSLGIQRETPGFRTFILQPEADPTGTMAWAEGHYDSMYGRIESSWRAHGESIAYRFTVPANTTATLRLLTSDAASVREGGKAPSEATGVTAIASEPGRAVYRLASGTYEFTARR